MGRQTVVGGSRRRRLGATICTALLATHVDASTRATPAGASVEVGLRDVLHSPPLLLERGRPVNLRYEVVCESDAFGAAVRAHRQTCTSAPPAESAFARIPLVTRVGLRARGDLAGDDRDSGRVRLLRRDP